MKYLLSSAVITSEGLYSYQLVTLDFAQKWLRESDFESYVGYQETADVIERFTGVKVKVNRGYAKMNEGDEALVFRLTFRVGDPSTKGKLGKENLMEYLEIGLLKKI